MKQILEGRVRYMVDTKITIGVIIFIILVSFQYTFNRILKELIEIKNILRRDTKTYHK